MWYSRVRVGIKSFSTITALTTLLTAFLWTGNSFASPYTYSTASNGIVVMDVATKQIVARVLSAGTPFGLVVNAVGSKLYTTHLGSNELRVWDTTTNAVVARKTISDSLRGIALDDASNRLYVGAAEPHGIYVLDATTLETLAFVPGTAIDAGSPLILAERLKLSADGKSLFIANNGSEVYVLDTSSLTVSNVFYAGERYQLKDMVLSPDEKTVYISTFNYSSSVNAFTRAGVFKTSSVSFTQTPEDLVVSPSGDRLYVALGAANQVVVLKTIDMQEVARIQLGEFQRASALALSADGTELYVANAGTEDISVVNTETLRVKATANAKSQTHDITVGPDTYSVPSLSLSKVEFQQTIGAPSSIQTVRLTNTGKKDLNFASITVLAENFSVAHDCGVVLVSGGFCLINVSFKPIATGLSTGRVDFTYSGAMGVQTLGLEGVGLPIKANASSGANNAAGSADSAPIDAAGAVSMPGLLSLLALVLLRRRRG